MKRLASTIFLCIFLVGCNTTPSISVFGAYFPDWLICIVGAVIITIIIYALLRISGLLVHFGSRYSAMTHVALTAVLAFIIWLIFFKN
jgi:hypothetical protein